MFAKRTIQTDEYYAYRLSGKSNQIVERIYIEEYKAYGKQAFHIPRETKEHNTLDPKQTNLIPESK